MVETHRISQRWLKRDITASSLYLHATTRSIRKKLNENRTIVKQSMKSTVAMERRVGFPTCIASSCSLNLCDTAGSSCIHPQHPREQPVLGHADENYKTLSSWSQNLLNVSVETELQGGPSPRRVSKLLPYRCVSLPIRLSTHTTPQATASLFDAVT
jgi:C1A family cysteine protease